MGAGVSSSYAGDDSHGGYPPSKPNLGDLPESCIAYVLSYLDPPEICKFSLLNRAFRRASWADFIWESKLPSNYKFLFGKVFDENPDGLSKKEIYAKLCRPNRFDGSTKEVWLEKMNGGVCFAISSKAMRITGIYDRRYWNHIPTGESRFHTIAYLQQIWWLEVDGELEFLFPAGTYSIFFRLQLGKTSKRLGRRICKLDQVHGWDIKPVQFQLSTSNGQRALSECYLYEHGNWVLYHVGNYIVNDPNTPVKIKFSMIQIDCTHTKGGLSVDSVLIYPSEFCPNEFRERLKNH